MNSSTRTSRIATPLATIAALLVVGASAQAATLRPAGMSKGAYESLVIRSKGLDERYGPTPRPAGMSKGAYQSLVIRSKALDDKYGLGGSQASSTRAPVPPSVVSRDGFVWADFGIGAAAMLGAVLVSLGLLTVSRAGRRVSRTRVSS